MKCAKFGFKFSSNVVEGGMGDTGDTAVSGPTVDQKMGIMRCSSNDDAMTKQSKEKSAVAVQNFSSYRSHGTLSEYGNREPAGNYKAYV